VPKWIIKPSDTRLFANAIAAIERDHPWPWRHRPLPVLSVSDRDDELQTPDTLQHRMLTHLNDEAVNRVLARVRKARYRARQKQTCVHLDVDAWRSLKDVANELGPGTSLSETVRMLCERYQETEQASPEDVDL